jgi:hypothetical protein
MKEDIKTYCKYLIDEYDKIKSGTGGIHYSGMIVEK